MLKSLAVKNVVGLLMPTPHKRQHGEIQIAFPQPGIINQASENPHQQTVKTRVIVEANVSGKMPMPDDIGECLAIGCFVFVGKLLLDPFLMKFFAFLLPFDNTRVAIRHVFPFGQFVHFPASNGMFLEDRHQRSETTKTQNLPQTPPRHVSAGVLARLTGTCLGERLFGLEQTLECLSAPQAGASLELGVVHVKVETKDSSGGVGCGPLLSDRHGNLLFENGPLAKLVLQAADRIHRHEMKQEVQHSLPIFRLFLGRVRCRPRHVIQIAALILRARSVAPIVRYPGQSGSLQVRLERLPHHVAAQVINVFGLFSCIVRVTVVTALDTKLGCRVCGQVIEEIRNIFSVAQLDQAVCLGNCKFVIVDGPRIRGCACNRAIDPFVQRFGRLFFQPRRKRPFVQGLDGNVATLAARLFEFGPIVGRR